MSEKIKGGFFFGPVMLMELFFRADPENYNDIYRFEQALRVRFYNNNTMKVDIASETMSKDYKIRLCLISPTDPIAIEKFRQTVIKEAKDSGIQLTFGAC